MKTEDKWKETFEIISNSKTIEQIELSLKQLKNGEGIPLSEL